MDNRRSDREIRVQQLARSPLGKTTTVYRMRIKLCSAKFGATTTDSLKFSMGGLRILINIYDIYDIYDMYDVYGEICWKPYCSYQIWRFPAIFLANPMGSRHLEILEAPSHGNFSRRSLPERMLVGQEIQA